MTTKFDPSMHMLVAVYPETGEHVHVPVPEMVKAAASLPVDPSSAKRIAELEQQVAELHEAIARIVAASNDQLKAIIAVDKRIEGMTLERIRVA